MRILGRILSGEASREAALTKTPKNNRNNKIVFNLDYHPAFKNVGAIIRKHLPVLNKSARMKEIFDPSNTRILTGFRRHKNLKELLSPASFPNTHRKQQPPPNAGCQKCKKKCFVCQNFLLESPSITSAATGASFKIKEALSCKDTWVIYCAICTKCNLQDVGSTKTPFYTRWSNHKSHINCKRKTCTLTKHFIEKKYGFENLKVTVIEKVKIKTVENLENRKGHWQRQLFTIKPHGMNVRKEFERGDSQNIF